MRFELIPAVPLQLPAFGATLTEEDEEAPEDLPKALSHFVQRNDEFELISDFFKKAVENREDTLFEEVLDDLYREYPDHLKRPSKTEYLDTYRQKLVEAYDDLQDQIYLSALLLPLCVRDDLLTEALEKLDSQLQRQLAFDDDILSGRYEPPEEVVVTEHKPLPHTTAIRTTKIQTSEIAASGTTETHISRTRDTSPVVGFSGGDITK